MPHETQAYAKIVGPGWHYYMTKPKIILGRGGTGVDCDVILTKESAVSRQHFSIRFAPEHEAIEVENLSKNGILVNGQFLSRFSAPILLRSQGEIAYGRPDAMRISLLLPVCQHVVEKKRKQSVFLPLLPWVGQVLVRAKTALPTDELVSRVWAAHAREMPHLDRARLANSIRHVLVQNEHIFQAVDPPCVTPRDPPPPVRFAVRTQEQSRFIQYAQHKHAAAVHTHRTEASHALVPPKPAEHAPLNLPVPSPVPYSIV